MVAVLSWARTLGTHPLDIPVKKMVGKYKNSRPWMEQKEDLTLRGCKSCQNRNPAWTKWVPMPVYWGLVLLQLDLVSPDVPDEKVS